MFCFNCLTLVKVFFTTPQLGPNGVGFHTPPLRNETLLVRSWVSLRTSNFSLQIFVILGLQQIVFLWKSKHKVLLVFSRIISCQSEWKRFSGVCLFCFVLVCFLSKLILEKTGFWQDSECEDQRVYKKGKRVGQTKAKK